MAFQKLLFLAMVSILFTGFRVQAGGHDGGSNFEHARAKLFLSLAAEKIANELYQMNAQDFANHPEGLKQSQLSFLIRNIELHPRTEIFRTNAQGNLESLMFELSFADGHYTLKALKPFFTSYSNVRVSKPGVDSDDVDEFLGKVQELKSRILDEISLHSRIH